MTTPKNVMKTIKDNNVKYVDFQFTDPRTGMGARHNDITNHQRRCVLPKASCSTAPRSPAGKGHPPDIR